MKYRIVRIATDKSFDLLEVQYKRWWSPFWAYLSTQLEEKECERVIREHVLDRRPGVVVKTFKC